MSEAKVKEKNFYQGPVLLIVVVFNEEDLQLLKFIHAIRDLEKSYQSKIA